ncbi:MAG TPA: zinc-dependent metalloprotease family protein, partial [Longimicrobiales bacterium]|nr:zinc-dependent metalloprotease family protein [Longimicrobiales bacterium]
LLNSWNLVLPAAQIRPGLSVLADVDPGNEIPESDEDDNTYPNDGTPLALTVQAVAPYRTRFVPVLQTGNGLTGDVNAANVETYLTMLRAIYPLAEVDADVRAAYTFTGLLGNAFTEDWIRLLDEINALRHVEDSGRYYYGVIKTTHTSGAAGLGYLGQSPLQPTSAIGVDWLNVRDWVMAHEVGHNFGRRHSPCGNPGLVDASFPYVDGRIGLHGWDMRTNMLLSAGEHFDIMSYCLPGWASDYTYESVREFRGAAGATLSAGASVGASAQPSLLVWGRISPEGLVLEPAFEVVARPVLPTARGAHQLDILDAAGNPLLELSFDGQAVDHVPDVEHFSFLVPLSSLRGASPGTIRLRAGGREVVQRPALPAAAGPGQELRSTRRGSSRVRLEWDAARHPVVLVRDARTGAVLSFARGGDVELVSDAAELDVHLSDGVRSARRRLQVGR